jgi:hypothetical protein
VLGDSLFSKERIYGSVRVEYTPNQSKNCPTLIYIKDICKVMKRQHQNLEFGHKLGEIHSKETWKRKYFSIQGGVETQVPYIVVGSTESPEFTQELVAKELVIEWARQVFKSHQEKQ